MISISDEYATLRTAYLRCIIVFGVSFLIRKALCMIFDCRERPRRIRSAMGAVALTAFIACWPAAPASAHAGLVSSDPGAGARLSALPSVLTLTFGEAVDPLFATVTLGGSLGKSSTLTARQGASAEELLVPVPDGLRTQTEASVGQLVDSVWVVRFRVTSQDGHPVEGEFDFKVSAAEDPRQTASSGNSSATPSEDAERAEPDSLVPKASPPSAERGQSSSATASTLVVGAIALIGAAIPCVLLIRARRRSLDALE